MRLARPRSEREVLVVVVVVVMELLVLSVPVPVPVPGLGLLSSEVEKKGLALALLVVRLPIGIMVSEESCGGSSISRLPGVLCCQLLGLCSCLFVFRREIENRVDVGLWLDLLVSRRIVGDLAPRDHQKGT